MATKKAGTRPVPVSPKAEPALLDGRTEQDQDQQEQEEDSGKARTDKAAIEWATPGTITERGFVPPLSNALTWVDCDLYPEYPQLRVGIRLGVAWRVISNKEQAPGKNPRERALRALSLVAPDFEGFPLIDPLTGQEVPKPDPADYETYNCIGWWTGPFMDIGQWILSAGYQAAYKQATKNA
jgi:hypothetical protein